MTENNRYLKGDKDPIIAPVHSYHAVEAGDFMVLNDTNGLAGEETTADQYAWPFDYCLIPMASEGTGMAEAIMGSFLGVAMESSPSGVTENITIATSGVFRYPLNPNLIGTAVTQGALIQAVSNHLGAGVSSQAVVHGTAGTYNSTAYLGYCVRSDSGVSFVDFQLRTAFGPGGHAS